MRMLLMNDIVLLVRLSSGDDLGERRCFLLRYERRFGWRRRTARDRAGDEVGVPRVEGEEGGNQVGPARARAAVSSKQRQREKPPRTRTDRESTAGRCRRRCEGEQTKGLPRRVRGPSCPACECE
ncbi:hypothetical protein BJY59DRAFT_219225 [Rhodotorula toruloides]